jgi:hypothetical protein
MVPVLKHTFASDEGERYEREAVRHDQELRVFQGKLE